VRKKWQKLLSLFSGKALVLGGKDNTRNLILKKKSTYKKEAKRLLSKLKRKKKRK